MWEILRNILQSWLQWNYQGHRSPGKHWKTKPQWGADFKCLCELSSPQTFSSDDVNHMIQLQQLMFLLLSLHFLSKAIWIPIHEILMSRWTCFSIPCQSCLPPVLSFGPVVSILSCSMPNSSWPRAFAHAVFSALRIMSHFNVSHSQFLSFFSLKVPSQR